jgi:hypothetical protein
MRTYRLAAVLAVCWGCGSSALAPGPGQPGDVQFIRLFTIAGVDQTQHIFLFGQDTVLLDVRMYAGDNHEITSVPGGVETRFAFNPDSANSFPVPGAPLRRGVTTNASNGTLIALSVTLLFLADSTTKTFGPFECLVH